MNYLLVMPAEWLEEYTDSCPFYPFPLGIGYISAAMKRAGLNLYNLNMGQVNSLRNETLIEHIQKHNIDVVLAGGLCTLYYSIRNILETAKSVNPGIVTVTGGGIISGDPPAAMEALQAADYGIIGEGEQTVVELCLALEQKQDVSQIAGLIFKKGDQYASTPPRPEVRDLSSLPWCDYEGFGVMEYLGQKVHGGMYNHFKWMNMPSLPILTSRSCPHHCTFCFHPEGDFYRVRDLDDVFRELDHLLQRLPVRQILFADELIGISMDKLKEFCGRIKAYGLPWTTSFRVTDITREKAVMMKQSGCRAVLLGLESASNKILDSMRKGIRIEQSEKALEILTEAGIATAGGFIFGDPEETMETFFETANWYLEHPQYNISFGPLKYYPGTNIYWRAVEENKIKDRTQYLMDNKMEINGTAMSDEEYYECLNFHIPRYKHERYLRLSQLENQKMDFDGHDVSITGRCHGCGSDQLFNNVTLFPLHLPFICDECGAVQSVSLPYNYVLLQENFNFLKKKYGRIGIWGHGSYYQESFPRNLLLDPDVYLFDRVPLDRIDGKEIEPPSAIRTRGLLSIITPHMANRPDGVDTAQAIRVEALTNLGVHRCINLYHFYTTRLEQVHQKLLGRIQDLLSDGGEVAFWGIGLNFISKISPEIVDDPRIYLVDSRQGLRFGVKKVHGPKIIEDRKISTVVVTPNDSAKNGVNPAAEIISAVRNMGVSKVISLNSLISL